MSNDTSNTILKAIETMVRNQISSLQADVTKQGTIKKLDNEPERRYIADYQGATIYLYAKEGDTYAPGEAVLFTAPEGDLSNKKIIQGLVNTKKIEELASSHGPTWDIIYGEDWNKTWGLTANNKEYDSISIFKIDEENSDKHNEFFAWGQGATDFFVNATFWTKFYQVPELAPEEIAFEGEYGLRITVINASDEEVVYNVLPEGLMENLKKDGTPMSISKIIPIGEEPIKSLQSIELYQSFLKPDADPEELPNPRPSELKHWNLLVKDISIGFVGYDKNNPYTALLQFEDEKKNYVQINQDGEYEGTTLKVSLLNGYTSKDFFEENPELDINRGGNVKVFWFKKEASKYYVSGSTNPNGWARISDQNWQLTYNVKSTIPNDIASTNPITLNGYLEDHQVFKAYIELNLSDEEKNIIATNLGIQAKDIPELKYWTNEVDIYKKFNGEWTEWRDDCRVRIEELDKKKLKGIVERRIIKDEEESWEPIENQHKYFNFKWYYEAPEAKSYGRCKIGSGNSEFGIILDLTPYNSYRPLIIRCVPYAVSANSDKIKLVRICDIYKWEK